MNQGKEEKKEGNEVNPLLCKLLKHYLVDEKTISQENKVLDEGEEGRRKVNGIDLEELSKFFVEGRVNWSFVTLTMGQMQEDIASRNFNIDNYISLHIVEHLLIRAGIILPYKKAKKINSYLLLRSNNWVRFAGLCNNRTEEFVFARKEDLLSFAKGWIVNRGLNSNSDLRFFSEEIKDRKVRDFPEGPHIGVDWLKEEKFPLCQN